MTMEILLGLNSLLMAFGLFCFREWWKGHCELSRKMRISVTQLENVPKRF